MPKIKSEDLLPGNSAKKPKMSEDIEDPQESLTPRDYQVEILEAAKAHNTIACLGTGTGKTFIAVMLIREMAAQARMPFEEGGKRIFFLVPTVPLVHQQAEVIENHTELKVGKYFGEMNVDTWSASDWKEQFLEKEVLVMTGEICRIILDHSFLAVSKICLLIFDECHKAGGSHFYAEIMRYIEPIYSSKPEDVPKIFGLTASLLNGKAKPSQLTKKLKSLEATMLSKIVTASDYDEVTKYGTDPHEMIVLYVGEHVSLLAKECAVTLERLSKLSVELREFTSLVEETEIVFFTKPYKSLKQLCLLYEQLGPWFACCAAKVYCDEIDKYLSHMRKETEIVMLQKVKIALSDCVVAFEKVQCHDMEAISHKLSRFLEIMLAMKNWDLPLTVEHTSLNNKQVQDKSPVCIVFVERRIVAYVLCKWINEIRERIPEYSFMKAEFIVGHGSAGAGLEVRESLMSVKIQQQVVKRFRNKEFNILIATSVLEEGMDIQKCNIVLRFDVPKDFRSYVQSKGRARAAESKYVVLLPKEGKNDFLEDLCTFKAIEYFLLRKCKDRDLPNDEEIQNHLRQHPIPPYQPLTAEGSPRITLSSAISIIHRYCAILPCDMTAKLRPVWKVEFVDPDEPEKYYVCTLRLPINCPLRTAIVGQKMKVKKLAKMAAALEGCILLHQMGELNGFLLPFKKTVDLEAKELGALEEEEGEDGLQPGTNKRKQLYPKGIADGLRNNIPASGTLCYLHVLFMNLVVPLAKSLNPRNRKLVDPADSPLGFALLTTGILPSVPSFPIFTKVGKIQVSVHCVNEPYTIDSSQLKMLESFHRFLFYDTMCFKKSDMEFSPSSSGFSTYIVPVRESDTRYRLDWDFIKYTLQHEYNFQKHKPVLDFSKFDDAVVTRTYKPNEETQSKPFYYVSKICNNMNPTSSFGELKYANFKEFYRKVYNIHIKNDNQPMLEVLPCLSMDLTKPIYATLAQRFKTDVEHLSSGKVRHANFREYLVPELCIIHPFSGVLFRKASYLPSILHRLNSLLLAEQIRRSVAVSENVGTLNLDPAFCWPVFNFEKSDKDLRKKLVEEKEIIQEEYPPLINCVDISKSKNGEISSFQVKFDPKHMTGPSPGAILIALTTKSAGDEFDLERLETIGDSFLKYAVSIKVYSSYPLKDEGCLTLLRSRLICNRHLYQLAKKRNIPKYMVHRPFLSKASWVPPCYKMEENVYVKNRREDKKLVTKVMKRNEGKDQEEEVVHLHLLQLISDKCIADSVEALIGVYLLSCGQQGALHFMSWMGIDPFVKSEEDDAQAMKKWPPVPRSPFVVDEATVKKYCEGIDLMKEFEQFQARINYRFKEPGYLFQAFTHPSYHYNEVTDCYQRLEFLGDAVLDYLITRKLYDDPKEHGPGKLTDLRTALVNNTYFASLAVKYGYHKNLKCLSVTLCKLIDQFIEKLQESEAFQWFEKSGYYLEEIECFDLEEVEVPKALGDLFESVAGAIYLDSGMSLDTVWRVYYPMMKPAIDHLSESVPKSAIRELMEFVNTKDIFDIQEIIAKEKYTASITLQNGQKFEGVGPNKKVAKRSAAKRAVYYLKYESMNQ